MSHQHIPFTKMHGAGNDFVVLDNRQGLLPLTVDFVQRLAHRNFGVGADQVLVVEQPDHAGNDFKYRIFNADGQEVQQCGNGARCFAQYVVEKGLTPKTAIQVETLAGVITPTVKRPGWVQVNMGPAEFTPVKVPFNSEGLNQRQVGSLTQFELPLDLNDKRQSVWVAVASMGNPHVVLLSDQSPTDEWVNTVGPLLEAHPRFPQRVNVGFLSIIERDRAKLRVYERGVGETLACGTGACAAAVVGMSMGLLDNKVNIIKKGGVLTIEWNGEPQDPVWMTGPAETVFEGVYVYDGSRN